MRSALLSQASCEHGTPRSTVELIRYVLGGIDCDPASSDYWNRHVVRAKTFFDRETDGLRQRWFGRVHCNSPGADDDYGTESLMRPYWNRLVDHWREGAIDGGMWVGFSVSQVGALQGEPTHPLMFPTLFLCEREKYLRRPTREDIGPDGKPRLGADGKPRRVVIPGPPVEGAQPTHFNYLTLLPSRRFESDARAQMARFRDRGSSLGALTRSWNP